MHPNTPKYDELVKIKEELQTSDPETLDVRKLKAITVQIARCENEVNDEK